MALDGGEGESDEGGGGYAKAVADCHASYGGGDGVRHVEGYLYAGTPSISPPLAYFTIKY